MFGMQGDKVKTIKERFYKMVRPNMDNDCWEWVGAKNAQGYGHFNVMGKINDKKLMMAHRVAYYLKHGNIPNNLYCCHKCDNPSCVNPSHLFLGTAKDNIKDMKNKNRQNYNSGPKGSACSYSKLNEKKVLEIREKYKPNGIMSALMLSKKYGVARTTIESIIYRKNWKHV